MKNRPLIILDRDGTLLKEPRSKQIDRIEQFELLPDLFKGFEILKPLNPRYIMITNQDGLGSKNYPKNNFNQIQNLLLNILQSQNIEIEKVLVCPHFTYELCECRKPKTKLLDQYLKFDLAKNNEAKAVVIGDRKADYDLAKNLNRPAFIVGSRFKGQKINTEGINFFEASLKAREYLSTYKLQRATKETQISAKIGLSPLASSKILTGLGFFDHMLEQLFFHAGMNLNLYVTSDLHIDDHHLIEDVALVLGKLFKMIFENNPSQRYCFTLPMDESLAFCAFDFSQRPHLTFEAEFKREKINDFSTEMVEHFFKSMSLSAGLSMHLFCKGRNDHHKVESLFKVFGRTVRQLKSIQPNSNLTHIESTKGVL